MTKDEAEKIAGIVVLVDGGCSVCVRSATERLMRDLPEIDWKPIIKAKAVHTDGSPTYWQKEVDEWKVADREWWERDAGSDGDGDRLK